jgi:hypothetical protein
VEEENKKISNFFHFPLAFFPERGRIKDMEA